ncbi:MAG: hypothetical protein ACI837_000344 [Crocinitomicaceae bacterium]|jgi:hypothetical protein
MKIAIIETAHFQYVITQSEIFADCEIRYITTAEIQSQMIDYSSEMPMNKFDIITSIQNDQQKIISIIENESIDLVLISPLFDSYHAMHKIVKRLKCIKVLTTHNINTWFNGRFWSPNSFKDRINMRGIIKHSDYICVEDFIYNHLKNTNHKYYQDNQFLYIPFTIFNESKPPKYARKDDRLKVVLTGQLDGDRRRYEEVLEVIELFKEQSSEVHFSFAGRAKGAYGESIKEKLIAYQENHPELVAFFNDDSTADMFRREMETSDIVLSTSTKTFKGMGTREYIGKTKPTAAIHDMMSYELPGLLPEHLITPANLIGSVFNYNSVQELTKIINSLLDDPSLLEKWKVQAKINSLKFTAKEIRKGLPF